MTDNQTPVQAQLNKDFDRLFGLPKIDPPTELENEDEPSRD